MTFTCSAVVSSLLQCIWDGIEKKWRAWAGWTSGKKELQVRFEWCIDFCSTLIVHLCLYFRKSCSLHVINQHSSVHIAYNSFLSTSSMHISIFTLRWMANNMFFASSGFMFRCLAACVCEAITICPICSTMAHLLPRTSCIWSVRKFLIYSPLCRITHHHVIGMWMCSKWKALRCISNSLYTMQHNAHSEYHAPQSIWGIVVENLHTIFDLSISTCMSVWITLYHTLTRHQKSVKWCFGHCLVTVNMRN